MSHLLRFLSRSMILATVLLIAGPPASAQDLEGLTSTLAVEQAEYGASEPLSLRYTLTNDSGKTLYVLKWQTPLEGFASDMFVVQRDGEPIPYQGILIKRGAPRPEDYVTLAPGESSSAVVDLAEGYGIYEAGDYSVELRSRLFDISGKQPAERAAGRRLSPKAVRSSAVAFKLREDRPRPEPPMVPMAEGGVEAAKTPIFKGCSESRRNHLNQAHEKSRIGSAATILVLKGTKEADRPSAKRYKTWFGTHTKARYDTVTSHYEKIFEALDSKQITFNCDCAPQYQNAYAYVYPLKPYEIFLCNAFWTAPLEGTDSKAGTLVHETSHFKVVADTDDHAYGHNDCKDLAKNSPQNAIDNADSHEYFFENDPPLSMGLDHLIAVLTIVLLLVLAERMFRRRGVVEG